MTNRAAGGRTTRTTRDLLLSMLVLVAVVLLVAGLAGMCSFSPGGARVDRGAAPSVDAHAELARAAREVKFPVRDPAVPAGWTANSFGLRPVGEAASGPRAVRVGWLLPAGGYLRFTQSDATEVELVRLETNQRRPAALGAVEVAGVTWVRYPSVRREVALVADVSGVRILVTGDIPEPDLLSFAAIALASPPLNQ
jgi:hypothetical protein